MDKARQMFVLAGFQLEDVPDLDGVALKVKHSVGIHPTAYQEFHETHLLIRSDHARRLCDELHQILETRSDRP